LIKRLFYDAGAPPQSLVNGNAPEKAIKLRRLKTNRASNVLRSKHSLDAASDGFASFGSGFADAYADIGRAFTNVLAKAAHSFAEFFSGSDRPAYRNVFAEACAAAPRRFSGAPVASASTIEMRADAARACHIAAHTSAPAARRVHNFAVLLTLPESSGGAHNAARRARNESFAARNKQHREQNRNDFSHQESPSQF